MPPFCNIAVICAVLCAYLTSGVAAHVPLAARPLTNNAGTGNKLKIQSVNGVSLAALEGGYYRLFEKGEILGKAAECAAVQYHDRSDNGFLLQISYVQGGLLHEMLGTFTRQNAGPFMGGRFVQNVVGLEQITLWILRFGGIQNGAYSFIVLGTPDLSSIVIDARDPGNFQALYQNDVFKFLFEKYKLRPADFRDLSQSALCRDKLPYFGGLRGSLHR